MDLSKYPAILYRISYHINDHNTFKNFALVSNICAQANRYWMNPKMTEFSKFHRWGFAKGYILPNGEMHGPLGTIYSNRGISFDPQSGITRYRKRIKNFEITARPDEIFIKSDHDQIYIRICYLCHKTSYYVGPAHTSECSRCHGYLLPPPNPGSLKLPIKLNYSYAKIIRRYLV